MARELKTAKTNVSVPAFLKTVDDKKKQADAKELVKIVQEVTGEKPVMWGTSIIGFGSYTYKDSRGTQHTWMKTGLSPRKQALTLYIMPGYQFDTMQTLLAKLGPHKTGKACLYLKNLEDIHIPTLKKIIKKGYDEINKRYR